VRVCAFQPRERTDHGLARDESISIMEEREKKTATSARDKSIVRVDEGIKQPN
jgi:hypothetical protein